MRCFCQIPYWNKPGLVVFFSLTLMFFSIHSLHATDYQLELGVQTYGASGDAQYGSNDSASTVDIKDDLGINSTNINYKPALYITSHSHKMGISMENISYDESSTLDRTIIFDDKSYASGSNVDSSLEMQEVQLMYRYLIREDKNQKLGLGVDLNLIELQLKMNSGTNDSKYDASVAIPALALEYELSVNKTVALEAKIAGFTTGENAGYLEYFVGTKLRNLLLDGGYWRLGYTQKHINIDESKFDGGIALKGFYLNYGLNFHH